MDKRILASAHVGHVVSEGAPTAPKQHSRPIFSKMLHELETIGTLFPLFQPIVPLPGSSSRVIVYEMLSRIETHNGLILQPWEFINKRVPVLVIDISLLDLLPQILESSLPSCHIAFNVAPSSLCDLRYYDRLTSLLRHAEVDPERLILEVTEDPVDAYTDLETFCALEGLREYGLRIALDDFGTGGNGIGRLVGTHFDLIKMSPALDVSTSRGRLIMQGILALIQNLSQIGDGEIRVVLEGVETEEQVAYAVKLGVDYIQGFALGHPLKELMPYDKLMSRMSWVLSDFITYS